MAQLSNIEWTDATWNPVRGCSRVSEGCRNCYAERVAARFSGSSPAGIMRAAERPQKVGEVSHPFAGTQRRLIWPLPNVWLGVSVEDQATANERIPLLIKIPAARRFVSYEPALGPVKFGLWLCGERQARGFVDGPKVDWLIVGGESGPGARPFDVAWARSAVAQCKAAGVPVFVKQLGTLPIWRHNHGTSASLNQIRCNGAGNGIGGFCTHSLTLRDRKGGDPSEWPEDLRVREFPSTSNPPAQPATES